MFRTRRIQRENPAPLMEHLEERLALYQGPMYSGFPTLASMETSTDTVVRILTNAGRIDVEMYDAVAPNTVQNFLRYITSGRFDESFFHRRLNAGGINILHGGGYKFRNGEPLISIPAFAPIANEFSRPNTAQTIAMAKVEGNPNSATSQFFFNMVDNPSLNTSNGGYTVFGKVIQGWDIVQAIAGLQVRDFDQQLTGSNPNPGIFDTVPVRVTTGGPTENTLVRVLDIEVIKARNAPKFYEQSYMYSDGFRSATTTERLDLVNTNDAAANHYQIIVRYETGERDEVISTGVLLANQRLSFKVNEAGNTNLNIVRTGVGYAFEVRSTRQMAVSIDRRDTGVLIGESFQMAARIFPGAMHKWNFATAERQGLNNLATVRSFLTYENATNKDVTVFIGIIPESGTPRVIAKLIKPFRRGGLALHTISTTLIPNGKFSIQISTNGPIVAALTQQRTGGGVTDASTTLGALNTGGTEGYLGAAIIPTGGDAQLDFMYTSGVSIVLIDTTFFLNSGQVLSGNVVTLTTSNRRDTWRLLDLNPNLPLNQNFTVKYQVRNNATYAAVSYRSKVAGDEMATSFQTQATRNAFFADGYINPAEVPASMQETISVFNPYANSVPFLFQLYFHFSDGSVVLSNTLSLAANRRQDINPLSIAAVATKINSNAAFRFYSLEVRSVQFTPDPTVQGAVVAQMTRVHTNLGQSFTTNPGLDPTLPVVPLSSPEFD
jgi:cyclophilin family peptidyl-prolyl cis-trans isomerase